MIYYEPCILLHTLYLTDFSKFSSIAPISQYRKWSLEKLRYLLGANNQEIIEPWQTQFFVTRSLCSIITNNIESKNIWIKWYQIATFTLSLCLF